MISSLVAIAAPHVSRRPGPQRLVPLRVELTITDTLTAAVRTYTSDFGTQTGQTDFTAFVK